ncbi:TonB-dependent receptor [Marinobacter sp. CHS3-4]|uniref:TonB-dependent receptor plug domain-containing protein n=1 Tax=Marinobacter sp. CHS3-4 TaxID=3045174 RepID=UPI0024B4F500|nr:TonB-dependent receptor [Marinobacter sp. CHS3-4]MDI9244458.1 TonB-dependent receptor [Marinobacter sp. CHS3-4]
MTYGLIMRVLSKSLVLCSVPASLLFSSAVLPQTQPVEVDGTRYLDELVVTGTRSERRLLDTPVRTEVVTAKEIEKTHARNLKEALVNVPGLQLRAIHGKAGFEVWLQGVSSDRVLVLIDGLPMTATTGSSVDVSQLAALDIERIEVVKGATSAQYGSSAMGGVVNVITRPPQPGLSGELTTDSGTYRDQNPSAEKYEPSRYSVRANVQGGSDALSMRLSGSHQHSDGVDPEPEDWAMPGDEFDRNDLKLRADWLAAQGHRIRASLNRFEEESVSRYVERNPPNFDNQRKDETVERSRLVMSGDHKIVSSLRGGWSAVYEVLNDDTVKFNANSSFDDRSAEHVLSKVSANLEQNLGSTHLLKGGVDLKRESLKQIKDGVSELEGDGKQQREGQDIWAQDTWMPTDKLELVPGFRVQNDSDFGAHVAPKINARYDLARSNGVAGFIRGGVGAGYRVPNLKERYYRFDHSELGYVVQGDEGLKPEESVSYQLGGGVSWNRLAWLETNAFLNDIDQLIQTYDTGVINNGVQEFRYENVAEARTWGLETTAGWEAADRWRITTGYTLTYTEDLETGRELNKVPRHQIDLGVDGPLFARGLNWSVRIRYQSDEFVDADRGTRSPGYTTADLKLNYRMSSQVRLFGGVDNATDVQRDFSNASEDFRPVAGRFAYAGLSVSFGSQ